MISTAVALQSATGNAIIELSTLTRAAFIAQNREGMTDEEFSKALFEYSAHLASITASLVAGALMSKSEIDVLLETIQELEDMGQAGE